MKKQTALFVAVFLCLFAAKSPAMAPCCLLDMGIFNNPVSSNRLEIRIRPTIAIVNGNYSGGTFVIRFPSSYNATISISTQDGQNPFSYENVGFASNAGYDYYVYSFGGTNAGRNWASGEQVFTLGLLVGGGVGTGTFELTVDAFAQSIAGGDAFYQELSANGQNGGGSGQQNIFYQASTSAALPVELLSFHANALPNGSTALDWESASEINLYCYAIEHSTDGYRFEELGKEQSRGGNNVAAQYVYNHKSPKTGINYYRLRMVDKNGSFEYSPIRSVNFDNEDTDFSVLPNLTSGPFILTSRHLEKFAGPLTYQLTENSGKLISMDKIRDEKTNFDLSNEPAGAYYLNILTERQQIAQYRIIVTKQ